MHTEITLRNGIELRIFPFSIVLFDRRSFESVHLRGGIADELRLLYRSLAEGQRNAGVIASVRKLEDLSFRSQRAIKELMEKDFVGCVDA